MKIDSCVILCGGKSSRFRGENGASKIFLPFGDKSLVARNFYKMSEIFKRVFIACKANQVDLIKQHLCHNTLGDIFIIESLDIFAPIIGIISALEQLNSPKVFFISCDCPFVTRFTIECICESAPKYDIVFAKDSSKIHPLIAVWSANVLPILRDSLSIGDFRLQNIIAKTNAKALTFDKNEFFNINTQENYATALTMLENTTISCESSPNHATLG